MIAYKLLRVRKDGTLGSLFVNRRAKLPIGKELRAKMLRARGLKRRKGWHALERPSAPHLSLRGRAWYVVKLADVIRIPRPRSQGGWWVLGQVMTILRAA